MTLTTIQNELDLLAEEKQSGFQIINTLTESRLFRQPQVINNLGKQGLKDLKGKPIPISFNREHKSTTSR